MINGETFYARNVNIAIDEAEYSNSNILNDRATQNGH